MTAFTVTNCSVIYIKWFYRNKRIFLEKKAFQKLFYKIPTSGVEKPDFQMGFENLEILQFFEFHKIMIISLYSIKPFMLCGWIICVYKNDCIDFLKEKSEKIGKFEMNKKFIRQK